MPKQKQYDNIMTDEEEFLEEMERQNRQPDTYRQDYLDRVIYSASKEFQALGMLPVDTAQLLTDLGIHVGDFIKHCLATQDHHITLH